MHTRRRITVGLLAAAALAATPAMATAMPMSHLPDPPPHAARSLADTADELAAQLDEDYAATHLRGLHNEMILVRHNPVCAVV
ncbi:MAG TPA: hypothetical protein VFL38_11235 [Humibacillus xanthopallidus]|nr:hypothetical protein [Humibacillus xanthopallidus]